MVKPLIQNATLISLCVGLTRGADKEVIRPNGGEPNPAWTYGILVDGTLYVSGMGGEDSALKLSASFEAEVKQSLENVGAVLKEAGMALADVVSVKLYLTEGAEKK